jgi:hypothetical protein
MSTARAVYTALFGHYELLNEQPMAAASDARFICFTDDPDLVSESWELVLIEPPLPLDMVRSQRDIKIRGHRILDEFDETLYIDNSVMLRQTPEQILAEWLDGADIAISRHSFREQVVDEFDAILELGYDDATRVNEQLNYYAELYPDVLLEHPFWNGMIARRNTPGVRATMALWYEHVLRFSRRDQLSANVAFARGSVPVRPMDINNNDAPSHIWPTDVKRRAHLTRASHRRTGPAVAEIARLHREIEQLQSLLDDAIGVRTADAPTVLARLKAVEQERDAARCRADDLERSLAETRSSTSWRLTAPLRWVTGARRH